MTLPSICLRLIPNLLSTMGILLAGTALFVLPTTLALRLWNGALMLDLFDGYLARRWQVESRLGVWLDTLDDALIYLLFPLILGWRLGAPSGFIAGLALLGLTGSWRLWRFARTGLVKTNGSHSYVGVPVYYILPLTILLGFRDISGSQILFGGLSLALAAGMVSTWRVTKHKPPVMLLALGILNVFWYVYLFRNAA